LREQRFEEPRRRLDWSALRGIERWRGIACGAGVDLTLPPRLSVGDRERFGCVALGVTPRMVSAAGMRSAPGVPRESSSKTWPRKFMLSRPIRVPSAVTQIQESPCLPPVDWITKCRAFAGGLASSATGTCASPAADESPAAAATRRTLRRICTRRLCVSAQP